MVTSAMLRTCAVRLPAIWLTLSVSSFHTPDTPLTLACPPSLPSVPTSRATRVTSEVKTESWSIMRFTSRAECRNSPSSGRPSTSSVMDWPKSPFATAPMVRVTSMVGRIRSSIRVFKASTSSAQPPIRPARVIRCLSRPSRPTRLLTRLVSLARRSFTVSTSLKASAILPYTPFQPTGRRTAKLPLRNAIMASNSISDSARSPSLPFAKVWGAGRGSRAPLRRPPAFTGGAALLVEEALLPPLVDAGFLTDGDVFIGSQVSGDA